MVLSYKLKGRILVTPLHSITHANPRQALAASVDGNMKLIVAILLRSAVCLALS